MPKRKTKIETQTNLPINIDDIDRAPANLPMAKNVNWEEKYHELLKNFIEIAEENITIKTENTDEKFTLKEENAKLRLQAETRQLLNKLIIPFANKSYKFMIGYCAVVGLMLGLHGFNLWFKLADGVLELLVGSTAVTVIGLVGMVLTGVFVGGGKR